MNKYLKNTFCCLFFLFSFLCSCNTQTKENSSSEPEIDTLECTSDKDTLECISDKDTLKVVETELPETNKKYKIFGVTTSNNDLDILQKLEKHKILKIDSLALNEEKELKFAIVEFASVKFGVNPGLIFMTSRFDKKAIKSLVSKISSFYGDPEGMSDLDNKEPQYENYSWNTFDFDKSYISIRPIHSEDGGLKMTWEVREEM